VKKVTEAEVEAELAMLRSVRPSGGITYFKQMADAFARMSHEGAFMDREAIDALLATTKEIRDSCAAEADEFKEVVLSVSSLALGDDNPDAAPELRIAANILRHAVEMVMARESGLAQLVTTHRNLPTITKARAACLHWLGSQLTFMRLRRDRATKDIQDVAERLPPAALELLVKASRREIDLGQPSPAAVAERERTEALSTRGDNVTRNALAAIDRRFESLELPKIRQVLILGAKGQPITKLAARLSLACGAFGDVSNAGESLALAEKRIAKVFNKASKSGDE
jgi:hypothetical protein